VELLHKLRDEERHDSLAELAAAIAGDAAGARAFLAAEAAPHAATGRQTTRDRI
jgi:riboflavin kinase/FMN adenylyltransferase